MFELSKVENLEIRARLVSYLLNVDDESAEKVANWFGFQQMPKPAEGAEPTCTDVEPSPALTILHNGPVNFKGRRVGALVTNGVDGDLVNALKKTLEKEGETLEFIAPTIGGVKASDSSLIEANQTIDGRPSVLYDAIALLISKQGQDQLANNSATRDFVADVCSCEVHRIHRRGCEVFDYVLGADKLDDGFIQIRESKSITKVGQECRKLRFWKVRPVSSIDFRATSE